MPKGIYDRGASRWEPRRADDPPELVDRIRSLYESGLTIAEVQRQVPGCKVQRVMSQHGIPRRRAIARMCVSCHRNFDAARRAATGERTSPVRRSA